MTTSTAQHPKQAMRQLGAGANDQDALPGRARLTKVVVANVVLLTMIAPLATDMYVPAFPLVGSDLGATATEVQLTLTTYFVGMALGQLIGGPVSDQRGRRRPLLASLVIMMLASALCAFSPSISVMMLARLVQGFSGGWAMVIARSLVVDLASGPRLVEALNLVQGIAGVAPIVGPLLGALILQLSHWRMSFWLLAAWSAVMLVTVAVSVPESLPPARRHGGGLRQLRGAAGQVLRSRGFVGYLVVMAFSMGVTFAYVATSAFVLQSMNGLSPVTYSLDFAANAVGLTLATLAAARLAGKVSTRAVIATGLAATAAAGVLLLVGALWFGMPLWVAVVGFFVLMTAQGLVGPNAGALASGEVPEHPGTGSSVLGFLQWCTAGVIAPLAGLGGTQTAVPMAVIVLTLVGVSFAALRLANVSPPDPPHKEQISMRATLMYGAGDVRVEEVADSKLEQPTDALVRITASCVCGSDLHPYASMSPEDGPARMGHEFIGVIEETGADVATLNKGDLVVAPFAFSDGTCQYCRAGLQTSCEHGGFWDMLPGEGGQAEAIRVPLADGTLFKVPGTPDPALIPSLLTISDVLGTGYHAAVQGRVGPDTSVTVIGDGAVGLLAVLSAKRLGADQIILMGRHQARTDLGRQFGATDVVSSRGEEGVAAVRELTGGHGTHVVLEAVGHMPAYEQAFGVVRPGGTISRVGVPQYENAPVGFTSLFGGNITLTGGPAPTRAYMEELLPPILDGTIAPGKVFDAVTDLDGVPGAYRDMADRKALKVLIQ